MLSHKSVHISHKTFNIAISKSGCYRKNCQNLKFSIEKRNNLYSFLPSFLQQPLKLFVNYFVETRHQ